MSYLCVFVLVCYTLLICSSLLGLHFKQLELNWVWYVILQGCTNVHLLVSKKSKTKWILDVLHLQRTGNGPYSRQYSDTSANECPCSRIFRLTKIFFAVFRTRLTNVLVDARANTKQQTGHSRSLSFPSVCVWQRNELTTSHRGDPPSRLSCLRSRQREVTYLV